MLPSRLVILLFLTVLLSAGSAGAQDLADAGGQTRGLMPIKTGWKRSRPAIR